MGAHKKSPPNIPAEAVTILLKKQVAFALLQNDIYNTEKKIPKGDPRRKISSHAELATALDADPNTIKHMFGGVRAGTKTKKIGKSKYVPRIRDLLNIKQLVTVEVRADRLNYVASVSSIPDDKIEVFDRKLGDLIRETLEDPSHSGSH